MNSFDEPIEEDGLARMSILEHLEELRSRIFKALAGVAVAFLLSLTFSAELWDFVCRPATQALKSLGFQQNLVQISVMDGFNIIYFKLPIICALFLGSPWVFYQVWAFISPGLYRRERRWAAPFILNSAGLFVAGGVFAYFVVFRYSLTFLLSIASGNHVQAMVSMTDYFDMFCNVILGVGLVFEIPVLIVFLTLLRVLSPGFLLDHSRYAILAIFIIAAFVTPTQDMVNLMLFATPMCLLFYIGIFAAYLVVLKREGRRFPWRKAIAIGAAAAALLAVVLYIATTRFGLHFARHWPFFSR